MATYIYCIRGPPQGGPDPWGQHGSRRRYRDVGISVIPGAVGPREIGGLRPPNPLT